MIVTEAIVRATWSPEYHAIREHYADRFEERSGVPLMQRVEEGLIILGELDASEETMRAFCLHPLFLADDDLVRHGQDFMDRVEADPVVIMLVMEYRSRANAWTSDRIHLWATDAQPNGLNGLPSGSPSAGPIEAVKEMLIADKVQGRKAFIRHDRGKHPRSDEHDVYFDQWFEALGVGRIEYEELCAAIDIEKARRGR
jgi:hypothetical protein